MTMSCGHWAFVKPTGELIPWYCGGAKCHRPECKKIFWYRRVRLIEALVSEHNLIRFFTLTLDPACCDGDLWAYIPHPWAKFRKRMKYYYPNFKFVAVLEGHKFRDAPHIHGFTNVWMHQRKWSHHWDACGGGRIVWVEKVETAELSEYVSKQLNVAQYVSKENICMPNRKIAVQRTLWRSTKLKAKFELTKEEGWGIIKEHVFDEAGQMYDRWKRSWRKIDAVEAEQQGKDMAPTCRSISPESVKTGISHLEAQTLKDEYG
jgi:hypothetical protein